MKSDIKIKQEETKTLKWQFSIDGKYIILNNSNLGKDFIKIVTINKDSIVIGTSNSFPEKKQQ